MKRWLITPWVSLPLSNILQCIIIELYAQDVLLSQISSMPKMLFSIHSLARLTITIIQTFTTRMDNIYQKIIILITGGNRTADYLLKSCRHSLARHLKRKNSWLDTIHSDRFTNLNEASWSQLDQLNPCISQTNRPNQALQLGRLNSALLRLQNTVDAA